MVHCFVIFNGNSITSFEVSSLKPLLKFYGLQSAIIRPHYFRIGACRMVISQDIPDAFVSEMGQHSTAFHRYIRLDKIVA